MSSSDEADAPVSAAEEAFVQRQNAAVKRLNALGTALIRGIDEDAASPGEEEVAACRILVITKERAAAIEAAQKFAMGRDGSDSDSDDDGGFVMFDTSTGNAVVAGIADAVARAVARTSKPARFDHLLALTYALQQEDTWARDNEMWEDGDEMQSACARLAAAWEEAPRGEHQRAARVRRGVHAPGDGGSARGFREDARERRGGHGRVVPVRLEAVNRTRSSGV